MFMHTVIFIIVCLLMTWLLLYLDHRAKFHELFLDIPGLIFGMLVSVAILSLVYGILKYVFEPAH